MSTDDATTMEEALIVHQCISSLSEQIIEPALLDLTDFTTSSETSRQGGIYLIRMLHATDYEHSHLLDLFSSSSSDDEEAAQNAFGRARALSNKREERLAPLWAFLATKTGDEQLDKAKSEALDKIDGDGRRGRLSLTSSLEDCTGKMVPSEATRFAFAYPLTGFSPELVEAAAETDLDDSITNLLCFLAYGGFVYWEQRGKSSLEVCRVTALRDLKSSKGGNLYFEKPLPTRPHLRGVLYDAGCVQPVTLKWLRDLQLEGFAWISARQKIPSLNTSARDWPYGAFVYFYKESAGAGKKDFILPASKEAHHAPKRRASRSPGLIESALGLTRGHVARGRGVGASDGALHPFLEGGKRVLAALHRHLLAYPNAEAIERAKMLCILNRAVEDKRTVFVRGHLPMGDSRGRWFTRLPQRDVRQDNTVWERVAGSEKELIDSNLPNGLEIMQGIPNDPQRGFITTHLSSDGQSDLAVKVERDAREWRQILPTDLGQKKGEERPRVLEMSNYPFQLGHGWYLVASDDYLKTDADSVGVLEPASQPRRFATGSAPVKMQLVKPYSVVDSAVISFGGASDFGALGIGVELYFTQLFSLAAVFMVMGLVSFSSLLTNLYLYHEAHPEADWTELLFIGSTLGSRTVEFNLFAAGMSEFGACLIFIFYLMWLRRFNAKRAQVTQETTVSAADYTCEVSGLTHLGLRSLREKEVAVFFGNEVPLAEMRRRGIHAADPALEHHASRVGGANTREAPTRRERKLSPFLKRGFKELRDVEVKAAPTPSNLVRSLTTNMSAESPLRALVRGFTRGDAAWKEHLSRETTYKVIHHVEGAWAEVAERQKLNEKARAERLTVEEAKAKEAVMRGLNPNSRVARSLSVEEAGPGMLGRIFGRCAPAASDKPPAHAVLRSEPSDDDNEEVGDRCFVTFRYATDADLARKAYRPWSRLGSALSTVVFVVLGAYLGGPLLVEIGGLNLVSKTKVPADMLHRAGSVLGVLWGIYFGSKDPLDLGLWLRRFPFLDRPEGFVALLMCSLMGVATAALLEKALSAEEMEAAGIYHSQHDHGRLRSALGFSVGAMVGVGVVRWKGWTLLTPGCCAPAEPHAFGVGVLSVRRAPEPTDIIWENLGHAGSFFHHAIVPVLTSVLAIVVLLFSATLLLALTNIKMQYAEEGRIREHQPDWLQQELATMLLGLKSTTVGGDRMSGKFLVGVVSGTIVGLNIAARKLLGHFVDLEKPKTWTSKERNLLFIMACVYIFNYVLLMLRVHTPVKGDLDYGTLLHNITDRYILGDGEGAVMHELKECANEISRDGLVEEVVEFTPIVEHIAECSVKLWHSLSEYFIAAILLVIDNVQSSRWYSVGGVVPQMIALAITDVAFLILFSELITLFTTIKARVSGSWKYSREAIEEAYQPPEWRFSDRYAQMLKQAAIVLVFAPAAPVLYFIGGIALLTSALIQKTMLVKLYGRPRNLDDDLAERSRDFLQNLLFAHVITSPIFYAERARATGSRSGSGALKPFMLTFGAFFIFVAVDFVSFWHQRDPNEEESGAGARRFQQARDEEGFETYSRPVHLATARGGVRGVHGRSRAASSLGVSRPVKRVVAAASKSML